MKISYNWLKSYIPEIPEPEKLVSIFTYHLCEVESITPLFLGEGQEGEVDTIFDINILPNRAHDLLSHQGIARELASLLNISYLDPTAKYKISTLHKSSTRQAELKIDVQSDKCRRYMGRIVRNVKVGPSPDWVKKHLESIGQRSINNIVDTANIVMFDCGQPIHCFDLDKVSAKGGPASGWKELIIREAKEGEQIITLDNKEVKLKTIDLVIADEENILAIAGVKGGKIAEVDQNTKNIIIEIGNFDPTIRKTGKNAGIFTDALKRFENDLSPELCDFAMQEMSALVLDNADSAGNAQFENVVDIYPKKQEERRLFFSVKKMSRILGIKLENKEVLDILNRYNFIYTEIEDIFEIIVPPLRLDLQIEEDMAEEIGRIMGYDKIIPKIPKINFKPKTNDYEKIMWARNKLLSEGYNEVMTYTFFDVGEVEVLESASDKKFLRNNLKNGLKESIRKNQINLPLLNMEVIKIFEIGTVFLKDKEEIHIAYGNQNEIKEFLLEEFCKEFSLDFSLKPKTYNPTPNFKMWSLYPFIVRDIALWSPHNINIENIKNIIKENMGEIVIRGPWLFDEFKKENKISYAFRLIFQSYKRTLKDEEVNIFMNKIEKELIKKGFEIR